jgi:hypothetical protein
MIMEYEEEDNKNEETERGREDGGTEGRHENWRNVKKRI